jgi:hypothetical protein
MVTPLTEKNWVPVSVRLPIPFRMVPYKTEIYQQGGYVDHEGIWHHPNGDKETHPVLFWWELPTEN